MLVTYMTNDISEGTQPTFNCKREWYSDYLMVHKIINLGFNESLGSPLLCAGLTVYAPLKRFAKPNMTCAVIGIGGLGHLAVAIATKMGMKVTAFTTSFNREEEIRSLGAHQLQHSTNVESLTA